ncbi:methyl-accepting chemotaxis protein [Alkalicoccobacillus murimartini]|uniref:Methyl-accepting chemotaxis protein n=1 Tax=Alkalicoccobacillus murimartini TaxID=171685 RepID=A0ABT9YHX6_9BACI|nr:methyl-accepting chemotaxis protein [Alkalicoccobacillus murimartini]MDQ0207121.1 methyl-accepting chemotaxis protein [Alkalicoccobacillus murimartini]
MKSVRGKLLRNFLVIIILFLGFSIYSVVTLYSSNERMEKMQDTDFPLLLIKERMAFNITDRLALSRGYVLFGDDEYLEQFNALTEESLQLEEELMALSNEDELISTIDYIHAWEGVLTNEVFPMYQSGSVDLARSMMNLRSTPIARNLTAQFQEMSDEERNKMAATIEANQTSSANLQWIVIGLTIFITVVMVILALRLSSSISNPLKRLVKEADLISEGDLTGEPIQVKSKDELGKLGESFNKMRESLRSLIGSTASMSENVAATAEQLSASSEETSAATNQIASTVQSLNSSAESSSALSRNSLKASNAMAESVEHITIATASATEASLQMEERSTEGKKLIDRAIGQIEDIHQTVGKTAEVMVQLDSRSKEIGDILELITSLSEQTNLLALNAAIEAARAGEHGKGFAVVADEVRKLAEGSKSSAGEIERMIKAIQQDAKAAALEMRKGTEEVSEGTSIMKEVGTSFEQISSSIEEVNKQMMTVSTATQGIAKQTLTLNEHITDMDQASKSNLESTEEAAASTEQQLAAMQEVASSAEVLTELANGLLDEVTKFKLTSRETFRPNEHSTEQDLVEQELDEDADLFEEPELDSEFDHEHTEVEEEDYPEKRTS